MSELIGFTENEISKKSFGGTELTKRSISNFISKEVSDEFQIIASRVRDLNEEKIRVYWIHDLAEDPELSHLMNDTSKSRFHKFVFVSNWQLQEFVTKLKFVRDEKVCVIENPIEPIEDHVKTFETINLIYFSTPQRGLHLLVPVFEQLAKKYHNIHLHVFSSFKIYGWEEQDKKFEPLYDRIRAHPQMTYHGFADHSTVQKYLKQSHILAYPSIWSETSCRVLIESMSAKLFCVHPNYAALPDTSGGLTFMYQYHDDSQKHAQMFYSCLDAAIQNVSREEVQNFLRFQKNYADLRFNINKVSTQWNDMLQELLIKYPNVESRKISNSNQKFQYKVKL